MSPGATLDPLRTRLARRRGSASQVPLSVARGSQPGAAQAQQRPDRDLGHPRGLGAQPAQDPGRHGATATQQPLTPAGCDHPDARRADHHVVQAGPSAGSRCGPVAGRPGGRCRWHGLAWFTAAGCPSIAQQHDTRAQRSVEAPLGGRYGACLSRWGNACLDFPRWPDTVAMRPGLTVAGGHDGAAVPTPAAVGSRWWSEADGGCTRRSSGRSRPAPQRGCGSGSGRPARP